MSSVFDRYYRSSSRGDYALGYRFARRPLVEDQETLDAIEAYNEVWNTAVEFFTSQRDELVDLPPEASERMFVEGVLGSLHQNSMDKADDINVDDVRAAALRLANYLGDIRDGASRPIKEYVDKLASSMRDLHNRIDPAGADAGPGAPDDNGDGGGEEDAGDDPFGAMVDGGDEPDPGAGDGDAGPEGSGGSDDEEEERDEDLDIAKALNLIS